MPGPSGHTKTEASLSKGWGRRMRSLNTPKSAPLSSTCCVHAASRVLGLLENHPHQAGLLHLEGNSGSSVPFYTCLPLPGQLLFPISPCEGGCQCMGSGARRSRSGLSDKSVLSSPSAETQGGEGSVRAQCTRQPLPKLQGLATLLPEPGPCLPLPPPNSRRQTCICKLILE